MGLRYTNPTYRAEYEPKLNGGDPPYDCSADDVRVETSPPKERHLLRCRSSYIYLNIIREVSEIEDMGASAIRKYTANGSVVHHYGTSIRIYRRANGGSRSSTEVFSAQSRENDSLSSAPIRISIGDR